MKRGTKIALTALVAFAAVLVASLFIGREPADTMLTRSRQLFSKVPMSTEIVWIDEDRFVYRDASADPARPWFVRSIDGDSRQIDGPTDAVPVLSPGGKMLAWVSSDVLVTDLSGTVLKRIPLTTPCVDPDVVWADQDRLFIAGSKGMGQMVRQGHLFRISAGKEVGLSTTAEAYKGEPIPTGDRLFADRYGGGEYEKQGKLRQTTSRPFGTSNGLFAKVDPASKTMVWLEEKKEKGSEWEQLMAKVSGSSGPLYRVMRLHVGDYDRADDTVAGQMRMPEATEIRDLAITPGGRFASFAVEFNGTRTFYRIPLGKRP